MTRRQTMLAVMVMLPALAGGCGDGGTDVPLPPGMAPDPLTDFGQEMFDVVRSGDLERFKSYYPTPADADAVAAAMTNITDLDVEQSAKKLISMAKDPATYEPLWRDSFQKAVNAINWSKASFVRVYSELKSDAGIRFCESFNIEFSLEDDSTDVSRYIRFSDMIQTANGWRFVSNRPLRVRKTPRHRG